MSLFLPVSRRPYLNSVTHSSHVKMWQGFHNNASKIVRCQHLLAHSFVLSCINVTRLLVSFCDNNNRKGGHSLILSEKLFKIHLANIFVCVKYVFVFVQWMYMIFVSYYEIKVFFFIFVFFGFLTKEAHRWLHPLEPLYSDSGCQRLPLGVLTCCEHHSHWGTESPPPRSIFLIVNSHIKFIFNILNISKHKSTKASFIIQHVLFIHAIC